MNNSSKANTYYYISLVCAAWFLITSWLWTYLANVIISFPFGLIALYLWHKGTQIDANKTRLKFTKYILIAGAVISIVALLGFLITN